MNKQEQISQHLAKPFEINDYVNIEVPYTLIETSVEGRGKNKQTISKTIEKSFRSSGTLVKIDGDNFHVTQNSQSIPSQLNEVIKTYYPQTYHQVIILDKRYITPSIRDCGSNPFCKEKMRIAFYNQDISALLLKGGYGRNDDFFEISKRGERINFNPFIIDNEGKKVFYQRELVWTLEQKQLLIDSIYNGIEIGKFLFRYNSWKRLQEEEKETGYGHGFDCVDGKQRFQAILSFLLNEFKDSYGNYWDDLSEFAKIRFLNYSNLSYGELPESATDEDVLDNFLTLNHTGTPMSKEHIDFIKSINL